MNGGSFINFDANATYGVLPEVVDEVLSNYSKYLNPSSIHRGGQVARAAIEEAREQVRDLIGAGRGDRIVFTSGATESSNTAIISALAGTTPTNNVVCSNVEHPAVLECCRSFSKVELRIEDPHRLSERVDEHTRLVTLMLANNETGKLYPVSEVFTFVKSNFPWIATHSDCVQALGKVPLNFKEMNADTISLSGHKIGAFSGVGALVIKEGSHFKPLIYGGPQEVRFRAGTENTVGIISFGIAARIAKEKFEYRHARFKAMKQWFLYKLESELSKKRVAYQINFKEENSLPNTVHLRFPGRKADDLLIALDLEGVLVSAGSACASGKPEASHVLLAHGFSEDEARECIRISFRAETTFEELATGLETLVRCL
jgi:cysteine desulfurase